MDIKTIELITKGATIFIVVLTIAFMIYIYYAKSKDGLLKKRRRIENLPSIVSTCGVIGTFAGITIGLINFNTADLDNSIPLLLEGLKTAFYTSLAGMGGSLILSFFVNRFYDKKDEGVSDINIAAGEIVRAVKDMSEANKQNIQELKNLTERQITDQTAFYNTIVRDFEALQETATQTKSDMASLLLRTGAINTSVEAISNSTNYVANRTEEMKNHIRECAGEINHVANEVINLQEINKQIREQQSSILSFSAALNTSTESMLQSIGNMEETTNANLEVSKTIQANVGEITDHTEAIVSTEGEVSEKISALTDKLHGEVIDIEEKMGETNKLLETKFDEFTELLKKSNTEALVEVMKKVTEEFQKQMNALINKLIQENFDQLNKSVERLNTWQQENKEMIASLTSQYKEMATNFEGTSTTLTKVGNDTKALVSDGGKLEQLVNSLNEVLIKDENFKVITKNLTDTVELTKGNMTMFEESTKSLNEWVRKQRNFVDSVQVLIEKLEELNKIKDYGEQFWKETKEKMEEGVSFLSDGTRTLNEQLTVIDQHFYERLAATLSELDACIQAMVNDDRR